MYPQIYLFKAINAFLRSSVMAPKQPPSHSYFIAICYSTPALKGKGRYMKSKIIVSVLLLGLQINIANAGLLATTVHSRANCVNNESITWWLGHAYDWRVVSFHNNIYGGYHSIDTGYAVTWRQAAVHWGEAPLNDHRWAVSGFHYLSDYGNGKVPFDSTAVGDCSIYNGWWDY